MAPDLLGSIDGGKIVPFMHSSRPYDVCDSLSLCTAQDTREVNSSIVFILWGHSFIDASTKREKDGK